MYTIYPKTLASHEESIAVVAEKSRVSLDVSRVQRKSFLQLAIRAS